uniref:Uncharacterized protein n=1 Tax=Anguilla anguilla TaxID=7936 RepID=A0A0E9PTG8_ANGAN
MCALVAQAPLCVNTEDSYFVKAKQVPRCAFGIFCLFAGLLYLWSVCLRLCMCLPWVSLCTAPCSEDECLLREMWTLMDERTRAS